MVGRMSLVLALCIASSRAAAQSPVYPPSTLLSGVRFDLGTRKRLAPGSDNWAVTWADDGHQYASFGDGGGFGGTNSTGRVSLGFARIEGTKDSYRGFNVWGGHNAENPARFTGKCYGTLALGSVLYMWRTGNASGPSSFEQQELYRSRNHAATWEFTGVRFTQSTFPDSPGFFAPTFLQFGRAYQGSRDDYVYIYAPENINGLWNVQKPGRITLLRVRRAEIESQSSYEYFAGLSATGTPLWTRNPAGRAPVFSDPTNGVMRTSVSYNAGVGRYILTTQQVDRFQSGNGHIGIYEAPEPWGPWSTVLFANAWTIRLQEGGKTVFWNFSGKWASADGRRFVLIFTGDDNWSTIEGELVLRETPVPVLASIQVAPAEATLEPGASQQFTASGIDTEGDPMAVSPVWSATGGTISAAGLYTAGSTAGTFTVTATAAGITGRATVTISAPPPPPEEEPPVEGTPGASFLIFDGTDDFARIPYHGSLELSSGEFTIAAWIHPTGWGGSTQGRIVDHGGGSTGSPGWSFHVENSGHRGSPEALRVQINDDRSFLAISTPGSIELGQWQHVAVTFRAGTLAFYIDGVERGVHTGIPSPAPLPSPVTIGSRVTDGTRAFDGAIDEVSIWRRALSETEVRSLVETPPAGTESGLVASYTLDEGSGQTLRDDGPLALHATLGSTAGADSQDPAWEPTAGPANQAPLVDAGEDQVIELPEDTALLAGAVADDGLPAGTLSVSWSLRSGPAAVLFTEPRAATTEATFSLAGTYILRLSASDSELSSFDEVTVEVLPEPQPVLARIVVAPDPVTVLAGSTQQFTASGFDTNGSPMAVSPLWSATGGTIDPRGLYTAGATAGTFAVHATASRVSGSATVLVSSPPPEDDPPPPGAPEQWFLAFDGSDDYAGVPYNPEIDLASGDFTLAAWIRPDGWGENEQGRILDHAGGSGASSGWSWHLENSRHRGSPAAMRVQINDDGSVVALSEPGSIELGRWQHVAVTLRSGTLTFYADGVERGVHTGTPRPRPEATPLRIGRRATDDLRAFDGAIDEVSIWRRALSESELRSLRLAPPAGTESGLVASYPVDEGSGQTLRDDGPLALHATLGSTAGADSQDPAWESDGPANQAPLVDAGEDQAIELPEDTVILAGAVADDGLPSGTLSVSWSLRSGPAAVLLSAPRAATTEATFSLAGTYVLRLSASDSELSSFDEVTVEVLPEPQPVLARIVVAPDPVTVLAGSTQQFTASGFDTNGSPMAVSPLWSATGGTIDPRGLYTAGAAAGTFTVRATASGVSGSATVLVSALPFPGAGSFLVFDGDDDCVDIPGDDALDLAGGEFTLAAWIHPLGWGNNLQGRILDHGGGSDAGSGWSFHLENASYRGSPSALRVQINDDSSFLALSDTDSVELNRWQHVAVTFQAGKLVFYVGGVEKGIRYGVPKPRRHDGVVRIGRRSTDAYRAFDGAIDEVSIWSRALSGAEIRSLMETQPLGTESGIVACYSLDEGSGQRVLDTGPGARDGVLGDTSDQESSDPVWSGED